VLRRRLVASRTGKMRQYPIPNEATLIDMSRPVLLGDGSLAFLPTTGNACCCSTRINGTFRQIPHPSGNQFPILASRPDERPTCGGWGEAGGVSGWRSSMHEHPAGDRYRDPVPRSIISNSSTKTGLERCGSATPEWLGRLRNGTLNLMGRQGRIHRRGGYALCELP